MIELIACVGLHWIFKYGSILEIPRRVACKLTIIQQLLKCSLCLGFWCGLLIYMYNMQNILLPFASAAACWFADNLNNTLQRLEIKVEKQIDRDYN